MERIPKYQADLVNDEVLDEPYEHYRAIRDLGPIVHLEAHDLLATSRYADARTALGNPATYSSGEGVELKEVVNRIAKGNILMSDGEHHPAQRAAVGRPLTRKSLAALQPNEAVADTLVDGLVEWGSFDAAMDLAQAIPSTWFPIFLVGRRKPESISLTGPMHVSIHSAPSMQGIPLPGPTS